jgi:hypothetical protein
MYNYYPHEEGYTDVEFRVTGALVDPDQDDSFYVEVYDSSDTLRGLFTLSTDPAITKISTGRYKVEEIALDDFAEGAAYCKWYAKLSGVEFSPYPYIEPCFFVLEDVSGYLLCTVQDVKLHLKKTEDDEDDFILATVVRATSFIESYCGRLFRSRDYDESYTGDKTKRLKLRQFPVTEISAIEDSSDNAAFSYDDGDEGTYWDCDYDAGIVELRERLFPSWPIQSVRVAYTAGYVAAPDDLRQVCAELAAAKYYLRRRQEQGLLSKSVIGATMVMYRQDDLSPAQRAVLDHYKTASSLAV